MNENTREFIEGVTNVTLDYFTYPYLTLCFIKSHSEDGIQSLMSSVDVLQDSMFEMPIAALPDPDVAVELFTRTFSELAALPGFRIEEDEMVSLSFREILTKYSGCVAERMDALLTTQGEEAAEEFISKTAKGFGAASADALMALLFEYRERFASDISEAKFRSMITCTMMYIANATMR